MLFSVSQTSCREHILLFLVKIKKFKKKQRGLILKKPCLAVVAAARCHTLLPDEA